MIRLLSWLMAPLVHGDAQCDDMRSANIDEMLDEYDYREAWADYIAGCA